MIIIVGTLTATEDTIDEVARLSAEHSRRSRLEPGCVGHTAARDIENPLRVVFTERWADMDAVRTHFGVQAASDFVRTAITMSELPPTLELFEATATTA